MAEYAALITFPERSQTYEALSKISNTEGALGVRAAAVVERGENGGFRVADGGDSKAWVGTSTGTLIGMFVGILGGPLGMLLGMGVGALTGSLVDSDRSSDALGVIDDYATQIPPGGNAIVAETSEVDTAALDALISSLGGTITRRPLIDVVAEVRANEAALKAAQKAARKKVKKAHKHKDDDAENDARVAALTNASN